MNKKETKKIADWLVSIGATLTSIDGDILWHATLPYNGPMVYRDNNKTLVHIQRPVFNIYFEADINPNGVGDSKLPAKAMTYSMGLSVPSKERGFRCWYWYETGARNYYTYSRELEGLKHKILAFLRENN